MSSQLRSLCRSWKILCNPIRVKSEFVMTSWLAGEKDQSMPFHRAGEFVPALFTDEAKKALMELRSEHSDLKLESQKPAQKLRRNANASDGQVAKGQKDHQPTSFPPITMLLKPKDQSKVKLANLRQRQNSQIDPSKVTDASICEESLKKALDKLRHASAETGLNLNTKTLWVVVAKQSKTLIFALRSITDVKAYQGSKLEKYQRLFLVIFSVFPSGEPVFPIDGEPVFPTFRTLQDGIQAHLDV